MFFVIPGVCRSSTKFNLSRDVQNKIDFVYFTNYLAKLLNLNAREQKKGLEQEIEVLSVLLKKATVRQAEEPSEHNCLQKSMQTERENIKTRVV